MARYYCHRCDRSFGAERSIQQHLDMSPHHYVCPVCPFDGHSWEELLDHCEATGCRTVCRGCADGEGKHWKVDCDAYYDHLEEENVCEECDEHFDSPNSLEMHEMTHLPASIECYGCYRTFTTYAGMIIHLESGNCASGIDIHMLNRTAARYSKSRTYIVSEFVREMSDHVDSDGSFERKVLPYYCPTCGNRFALLSSLFQHAGSSACGQTLEGGAIGLLVKRLKRVLEP